MSVHDSFKGVAGWEDLPSGYLASAALAVRAVGFREVTEQNWPEVWVRIHLYEALWGAWTNSGGEVAYFSRPVDVRRLVGLLAGGAKPTSIRVFLDDLTKSLVELAQGAGDET